LIILFYAVFIWWRRHCALFAGRRFGQAVTTISDAKIQEIGGITKYRADFFYTVVEKRD